MDRQSSLFDDESYDSAHDHKTILPVTNGELSYYPQWLNATEASALQTQLREEVEWQQSVIQMYGKPVKIPRLNAWYGDRYCRYAYSGYHFEPLPWLPSLLAVKKRIECDTGFQFNSVLVNCYRDGNDSVAWHSDDEPELGRNPVVASVSLGAERAFHLRHRYNKALAVQKLQLTHGSLLIMAGELQHYWHHQVPKTQKNVSERINLTFRYITSQE